MNAEKRARAIARREIMERRGLMAVMKRAINKINSARNEYDKERIKSNFVTLARAKFSLEGPRGENLVPYRQHKAWEKFRQAYRNHVNNMNRRVATTTSPERLAVARRNNGRYVLVNNPA